MKFIARLAKLMALVAVVDGAIFLVLTSNLRNGVYPVDGDSLGIPFMESAMISIIAGGLLLASAAASAFSWNLRQGNNYSIKRYTFASMIVIIHLLSAGYFVLWGMSWAIPNHYWIVVACGMAASFVLYCAAVDLSQLRSNHSLQARRP